MNYKYYQHKRESAQASKEAAIYKPFTRLADKAWRAAASLSLVYLLLDAMLRANGL